ncbi:lovastatin nonaketide synthase [Mariannaea sp. PMI_226]|nr:lovastatin nonaketide synthase [Mariannaea sp. PMI_226]
MARMGQDGLEPIAICGMACRLPGQVDSPSALWKLLLEKKSTSSSKVPETRFNIDAHFHKNLERPGSFNVLGGYFLDGPAENFDPTFFNITPVEAMWLDPQQRKMLEVCYEALESAGVTLQSVAGSNTGVWVGTFTADYQQMTFKDADFRHSYAATGVDTGIISNRIGNIFDLNGPSCTINTACSSSIYAIHNACNSLRARDCDAALVGGVNLILTVDQHMNTAKLGVLSPTSFCHTFDESADGYGRGEGAGSLYLKRLDDAIRDGDIVRGVIRSSAVNTNGKVPGYGITYPNVNGQERVIRTAYKKASLDPNDTAYFECHGTGTRVGDPIEVRAVSNAMNDTRSTEKPLTLGAIKPNIGHSEAASGIFAVMKAAMMVEAGVIPGVAGLKTVNPAIPEKALNIEISKETSPWPQGYTSKRASVSSFGYGGTNGHVVVENVEALIPNYRHGVRKEAATYDNSCTRPLLVTLSAHDKTTLTKNIQAHAGVVDQYYLPDVAYTLNLRRSQFNTRGFVVATESSASEDFATANFKTGSRSKPVDQLAFIFTGQGAQWATVGRDAIQAFPVFRETIRRLDRVLKTLDHAPDFSIETELTAPAETSRINDPSVAQPTLVATEIAIVDLLDSWGITPTVTVGHSAGEYAASYAAGLASAPELIVAAYYRGYALSKYAPSGGSMMAIGLGAEDLKPYLALLPADITVACENSPKSVTLSGTSAAIQETKSIFDAEKVFARELRTGMAYHSSQMDPVAGPMVELTKSAYAKLDSLDRQWIRPRATMISSVTNQPVADGEIGADYWARNLTGRVFFDTAVARLPYTEGCEDVEGVVEIGPHSALAGPFKQICQGHGLDGLTYIPTIIRNKDSAKSLLTTAGELYLAGYNVDLAQVNKVEPLMANLAGVFEKRSNIRPLPLVDLPPYQWNYEKVYWAEPRASAEYRQLKHPRHDLLGSRILGLASQSTAWRNVLRTKDVPWITSHRLGGSNMFPAAGHMALAIEAVRQQSELAGLPVNCVTLRNFELKAALVVPDNDAGLEIQTRLTEIASATGRYSFTVSSCNNDVWSVHSEGEIEVITDEGVFPSSSNPVDVSTLTQKHTGKRWNEAFKRVGFEYSQCFDSLEKIRTNGKDYSAAGHMPINTESNLMVDESRYLLHPSTVDCVLQLCIISIHAGLHQEMPWGVVPVKFEEVTLRLPGSTAGSIGHAVAWNDIRPLKARRFNTSAQLTALDGLVVLDIKGLHTVAYEAALPPQVDSEARLQPLPFSGVVWKPDVSISGISGALSVEGEERSAEDAVVDIIELLGHKKPLSSVLMVDSTSQFNTQHIKKIIPSSSHITICGGSVEDSEGEDAQVKFLELPHSFEDVTADLGISAQDLIVFGLAEATQIFSKGLLAAFKPTFGADSKGLCLCEHDKVEEFRGQLDRVGFKFLDLVQNRNQTVLVFSLDEGSENMTESDASQTISLIYSKLHSAVPRALADALTKKGINVVIKAIEDGEDLTSDDLTLLYNPTGTLLSRPDPTTFAAIKTLLPSGTPVMWLTAGVNEGKGEFASTVAGFLRVVREEETMSALRLLDFDRDETFESIANAIVTINKTNTAGEHEYWLHKTVCHISRIVPNMPLCDRMDVLEKPVAEARLIAGKPLRGELRSDGFIFTHNEALETSAPGVNEIDILVERFEFRKDDPRGASNEPQLVFGNVIAIGSHVDTTTLGKKVAIYTTNPHDTVLRAPAEFAVEYRSDREDTLASLLPSICKAENALRWTSGSTGKRTVLLLPMTKAMVRAFALLRESRGFDLIAIQQNEKSTYEGIAAFDNLQASDMGSIQRAMTNAGTSLVVVAPNFSSMAQEMWRNIPAGASLCLLDNGASISAAPDATPFTRGARFTTTSISSVFRTNPSALRQILVSAAPLGIEFSQRFDGETASVLSVKAVSEGVANVRDDSVLAYNYGKDVINLLPPAFSLELSSEDVYLLVGCLGGLGRSLTAWMMKRGAKHFAFVSRSGADKPEAAQLIRAINDTGAITQVFRGDASNVQDVSGVIDHITSSGKRIRGVVHAAMVLEDAMLGSSMTIEKFTSSLRPKVDGVLALHHALRDQPPLDFFVMTSSISATVGQPGQSNYAAANSFLDNMALQRNLAGQAATSLILPMVLGVGVVAENDSLEDKISRRGMYGIEEREMLRAFEAAMSQPVTPLLKQARQPHMNAAIVLGLDPTRLAETWGSSGEDVAEIEWADDARFSHLRLLSDSILGKSGNNKSGSGGAAGFAEQVAEAASTDGYDAALGIMASCIMQKCGSILMLPVDGFEMEGRSVGSYGLDSMIGAELRNWLLKELGLNIAFQELLGTTLTFKGLSKQVLDGFGITE